MSVKRSLALFAKEVGGELTEVGALSLKLGKREGVQGHYRRKFILDAEKPGVGSGRKTIIHLKQGRRARTLWTFQ